MTSVDEEIEVLAHALGHLESRQVALFFAVCAERFSRVFQQFALKYGVANPNALRVALDGVWKYLSGGAAADWNSEITRVESATPHADDFDNLDATLAQGACILVDAALRSSNAESVCDLVEFAFEPFRATICYRETGNIQLGSGEEADEFERRLHHDSQIQGEVSLLHGLVKRVASWTAPDEDELKLLREFGTQNAVKLSIVR